jgi:hypothetical protein
MKDDIPVDVPGIPMKLLCTDRTMGVEEENGLLIPVPCESPIYGGSPPFSNKGEAKGPC